MSFNPLTVKSLLKQGEIRKVFIEELGWDSGKSQKSCKTSISTYQLREVAKKAGFRIWLCELTGSELPSREETKSVHRQLVKESYEHIIVFVANDRKSQVWLWVRREPNKQLSFKHHEYYFGQDGESLIQKLRALYISLEEEEAGLDIIEVSKRAKKAFDVERVTKKFYQDFDKHRKVFLEFIEGITAESDREWYASVMLNRLMFAYFIQKKGFLDSDRDYLNRKLKQCQEKQGSDKFYSFYRAFLLRLFHEGLGTKKSRRAKGIENLLGNIPYLNGGMFDIHELELPERYGESIEIKDQAFENLFAYFDQYQWHLDERPLKQDNEINPDVLGYIFEKYINQKQMGAYYTKEDITEYISKNTIIPYVFETLNREYGKPSGPSLSSFWTLLARNADDYIYPSTRHGAELALPADIASGQDVKGVDRLKHREAWNRAAPEEYALPAETWREVIARRERYLHTQRVVKAGEVQSIDGLIELNLDIKRFALDVIDNCSDPILLRSLWRIISNVSILDPTGGSGAFLFSALNVLEPLYEACLDRIEAISISLKASKHEHECLNEFSDILARAASHSNRRYYIIKSIILNNLYAVDIMDEAVEICKLRLFLKLAAQVEPDPNRDNLGIEPLPDIDFNIRAGNSLVGYATYDQVKQSGTSILDFDNAMEKIATKAAELQLTFDEFRRHQTEGDGSTLHAEKLALQKKLNSLDDELNRRLAQEYSINPDNKPSYQKWLKSYQPFHWFVHFYGILSKGGFDIIIGNPPYVEYSKKDKITKKSIKDTYSLRKADYSTLSTDNLYAFTMERTLALQSNQSWSGMIVPVSFVSGNSYAPLIRLMCEKDIWLSSFSNRPAKLFDGVEQRLTIYIRKNRGGKISSSSYSHWYAEERPHLFERLSFAETTRIGPASLPLKIGSGLERSIIEKITSHQANISTLEGKSAHEVWFHDAPTYWIRALPFEPNIGMKSDRSTHYHRISAASLENAAVICAILNSSVFYFFFKAISNCRDFGAKELYLFTFPNSLLTPPKELIELAKKLGENLGSTARRACRHYKSGDIHYEEYYPQMSKQILDQIDTVLSTHYGFTPEELDFIINYDIKYRLGRDTDDEEG